ncbi:aldo/keto reductase [Brevibacillus centrosporus]|jgi:aryl-alcohol dehydrogenase-like predicted oxidoreductase|uniref:aldo/keto reductase n=1 Tax=Brevibacillus centrosporus TaxID=54910 RepID=UPI002E215848
MKKPSIRMKKTLMDGFLFYQNTNASCIFLGAHLNGAADEKQSIETIHRALDVGIDLLDTADMYGVRGANEVLLGKALKNRRSQAIVATKFGVMRNAEGKILGINGHPAYVKKVPLFFFLDLHI